MYLFNNYSKQIGEFIASDSKAAFVRGTTFVILAVSLVGWAMLHYGAPVMNGRPWDVPPLLDGGWRIVNGQVPYHDFFVHHGPLAFYLTAFGMKVGAVDVAAIDRGAIALMAVVTMLALLVLSRRTSAIYTIIFTLFMALLVIAPRPLGDPYDFTDRALMFTRFGEALLMLMAVLLFLPPTKKQHAWTAAAEMVLAGLLLTLLVFNKVNYAMLGFGFCSAAVVFKSIKLRDGVVAITSAFVFCVIVLKVTGISLSEMLDAYRRVAVGFQGDFRLKIILIQAIKCVMLLPPLLILVCESAFGKKSDSRFEIMTRWAVPGVVFVSAVMLLASNTQTSEAPLLGFAAFYAAEIIRRDDQDSPSGFFIATRNTLSLFIVLAFVLPILSTDVLALRHSMWLAHRKDYVTEPTLRTTALRDLRFAPEGTRWLYSQEYMTSIAEGVDLLRRHADLRVMPLVFTDPFQMALAIKPLKGGILFWDPVLFRFHNSFPPLDSLIGEANALLVPADDQSLQQAYGEKWTSLHLQKVEQTKRYVLLKIPVNGSQTSAK